MAQNDDGKCVYGLGDLFGQRQVNHGDPDEAFEWKWPDNSVIKDTANLMLHLPDSSVHLMAQHVWQSSITLADEIARGHIDLKERHMLELGAGAGLPSLVSTFFSPASVMVTDYPEESIVANLRKNVEENATTTPFKCEVQGLKWAEPLPESASRTTFDLIIMADTLWMDHQHSNLLLSLQTHLERNQDNTGRVIATYMHHDDREEVANSFFVLATEKFNFEIVERKEIEWDSAPDDDDDPEEYGRIVHMVILKHAETERTDQEAGKSLDQEAQKISDQDAQKISDQDAQKSSEKDK